MGFLDHPLPNVLRFSAFPRRWMQMNLEETYDCPLPQDHIVFSHRHDQLQRLFEKVYSDAFLHSH